MEYIPKDKIMGFNPGVLEAIRGKYGLEGPGRMAEAVNILDEWIQQQTHFIKKDFARRYLESALISRKGSIERTKVLLDRYCTMRTLLPQFFGRVNVSRDIGNVYDIVPTIALPRQTEDNCRVYLLKLTKDNFNGDDLMNYFKYTTVLAEYIKTHDYSDGYIIVADVRGMNIIELISNIDLVTAKQITDIHMVAFGARVTSFYIVSDSKMVGLAVNIAKQVFRPKIAGRIEAKRNISELHNVIDKRILPKDYGGEEPSLQELSGLWIEALSSEEHLRFLEEMCEARTDESLRPRDQFNDQYAGIAGTFRALSVD